MKSRIIKRTVSIIILFFVLACHKEEAFFDQAAEEIIESVYDMNKVKIQDIPKIKNLIDDINQNSSGRTEGTNTPRFDFENILEVIDTLDNRNYSFHFSIPGTPVGTFYNLIVGQKEDGTLRDPFVIKYKSSPDEVEAFVNTGFDFTNFKGKVSFHKYTDYFELGYFSRGGETNCPEEVDEFGDPIPCEVNPVDGGSGGGSDNPDGDSGDVSEGSPDTDTGGSSDCEYLGMYIIGCGHENSGSWHPYAECGGHSFGFSPNSITSGMWDCGDGAQPMQRGGDDCADCSTTDGGVGVVTPSASVMRAELKDCLDLSPSTSIYLGAMDEIDLLILHDYMESNSFDGNCPNAEAKAFLEKAIEVMEDGGEVDFEERRLNAIVFDPTLPPCLESMIMDFMLGNYPYGEDQPSTELIDDVFDALAGGSPINNREFITTYRTANIGLKNGMTTPPVYDAATQTYRVTITISDHLVNNGTKLALIKTILHESMHAYLKYIAKKYPSLYADPNGDFSTLVFGWRVHHNQNYADHVFMANMIEDIATNIGNFAYNNYGYPNPATGSLDYYEAVAWSGIALLADPTGVNPYIENPVFLTNYPNPNDRLHIVKILDTENGTASYSGYAPLINNNCN